MLIQLRKYLSGYVRVRVEGYSPERLFNLCNANGILIWGVEFHEQTYKMFVSVKDYRKLRPFVRKTGTKIVLLEKHGLPFFLHRFRKRKVFFCGMAACIVIVYILSLFIWNIHVEGNITQKEEELLEYLETLGVEHGIFKSKIICENIETSLRSQYPNMLWVSAEIRGTRIIIQIKENIDEDIVSKIEVKTEEPVSIAADASGTIEKMVVRQGTPFVSVGDIVEKGQILVAGYYELKNDAGEIVRYEDVPADADIDIVTTEQYKDSFSMKYEVKEYTKKKRIGIQATIFDKTYKFIPKIPFRQYETVDITKKIHITENFYLPFILELNWFLEYKPKQRIYTKEEAVEMANFRYLNKYKNILQKGVQIIEKDVKIDTNDKLCIVGGSVTLRVPVTTKVLVIIPETSMKLSVEGEH